LPEVVGIGEKYKVAIRQEPTTPTPVFEKHREDKSASAEAADRWFLATLFALYGTGAFVRGNLDAGRLNRLFGREIIAEGPFDPISLDANLRINTRAMNQYFETMNQN